jgi:hypothetical protein
MPSASNTPPKKVDCSNQKGGNEATYDEAKPHRFVGQSAGSEQTPERRKHPNGKLKQVRTNSHAW